MKLSLDPFRTLFLFDDGDGGGGSDEGGDGKGKDEGDDKGGGDKSLLGGDPDDDADGDDDKKDDDADGDDDKGDESGDDDSKSKDRDAADAAPESYEAFTVPETLEIQDEYLDMAVPVFKELKLSQEQAQQVVDLHSKIEEAQAAGWAEQAKQWQNELQKDPEVGGANLAGNLQKTRALIDRGCSKEDAEALRAFFNDRGTPGSYPPLVRFLVKLANSISEDSLGGTRHKGSKHLTAEEREEERLAKRFPKMQEQLSAAK